MPLTSLCKDMDYNTALFYCIEKQNIKTFELITKIVSDFPGLCVTKMMVEFIPLMLTRQSPAFLEFFDVLSYKPLYMDKILVIPCIKEINEDIYFPTHTSLINTDYVLDNVEEF